MEFTKEQFEDILILKQIGCRGRKCSPPNCIWLKRGCYWRKGNTSSSWGASHVKHSVNKQLPEMIFGELE